MLWTFCAWFLLVLVLMYVPGCVPYAHAATVTSPAAVKSAIEAAVSQASVTATNYPAQLDQLGLNGRQAAVVRYSVAQAYLVAAAASSSDGQIPQSARDYVNANAAKLLQVGGIGLGVTGQLALVNTAVSSATTVGASVWADLRGLSAGGVSVGVTGTAPVAYTYPSITNSCPWSTAIKNSIKLHPSMYYYNHEPDLYPYPSAQGVAAAIVSTFDNIHGSPIQFAFSGSSVYWNGNLVAAYGSGMGGYVLNGANSEAVLAACLASGSGVPREGSGGTPPTASSIEGTDGVLFAEFLNVPNGIWDLNSGLYSRTTPVTPDDPALYPGLGTLAPGNPSIWQKAQQGPLFGSGYGIDTNQYTGPSAGLKQAADDLEGAIAEMGDWGAFNWVKEILYWLVAPFTTILRGVATVVDFFAGLLDQVSVWVSTLLIPSQQQLNLEWRPQAERVGALWRATPIGFAQDMVKRWGTYVDTWSAAAPASLNLQMQINGVTVPIPLQTWLDQLHPVRQWLVAGVVLVFIGQIAGYLKPFVS